MKQPSKHIETKRLSLRAIAEADFSEAYAKWGKSEIVARYMSWKCGIPAETEKFIRYAACAWDTGEEFTWVIEEKNKPGLIGSFGIRMHGDHADFGYLLMPEFWGRGYIAEAGKPIIDWCKSLPDMRRIWSVHHVDNPNSGRVMQKLGLKKTKVLEKHKIYPQLSATELQDECLYSLLLPRE